MSNYTVANNEELRRLCIKNNWFTNGDNQQYQTLFDANEQGLDVRIITAIIWICSSGWKYDAILHELAELDRRFEQ